MATPFFSGVRRVCRSKALARCHSRAAAFLGTGWPFSGAPDQV
jgi:hypothetical protein